jgi:hypothetical protein
MPIKEPTGEGDYTPSEKETAILRCLQEKMLIYSSIKTETGLSDSGLSTFLRRLQYHNMILRDERRIYHITAVGVCYLMSLNPTLLSEFKRRKKLRTQRTQDEEQLWNELRRLQDKILRITWLPYADETSRLIAGASGLGVGVYLAALKSKDGKHVLCFKTPGVKELKALGYVWK